MEVVDNNDQDADNERRSSQGRPPRSNSRSSGRSWTSNYSGRKRAEVPIDEDLYSTRTFDDELDDDDIMTEFTSEYSRSSEHVSARFTHSSIRSLSFGRSSGSIQPTLPPHSSLLPGSAPASCTFKRPDLRPDSDQRQTAAGMLTDRDRNAGMTDQELMTGGCLEEFVEPEHTPRPDGAGAASAQQYWQAASSQPVVGGAVSILRMLRRSRRDQGIPVSSPASCPAATQHDSTRAVAASDDLLTELDPGDYSSEQATGRQSTQKCGNRRDPIGGSASSEAGSSSCAAALSASNIAALTDKLRDLQQGWSDSSRISTISSSNASVEVNTPASRKDSLQSQSGGAVAVEADESAGMQWFPSPMCPVAPKGTRFSRNHPQPATSSSPASSDTESDSAPPSSP